MYSYEKNLNSCEVRKVVVVVLGVAVAVAEVVVVGVAVLVVIHSASFHKNLGSPVFSSLTSYLDMAMLTLLLHLHLVLNSCFTVFYQSHLYWLMLYCRLHICSYLTLLHTTSCPQCFFFFSPQYFCNIFLKLHSVVTLLSLKNQVFCVQQFWYA
jgi:hypothetical protein